MNKRRVAGIVILIVVCASILTGCTKNKKTDEKETLDSVSSHNVENPFELSEDDESISSILTVASYGYGILDRKERYVYEGNLMEIPIEVNNREDSIEVGIMIFIDGIPQRFSFKEDEKLLEEYVKAIELPKKSKIIKTAVFTPTVGKKGDVLKLHVTSLLNPSYIPEGESRSFNVNHSLLDILPVELEYKADSKSLDYKENFIESIIMSEEARSDLQIREEPFNDIQLHDDNAGRYNSLPCIPYIEGSDLNLKISAYGVDTCKYRTTIFVNHLPIKTLYSNDYYDYYDVSVQKDYLARIDFTINHDEISEKNNFIYAISVPLKEDANVNGCLKTSTKLLLPKEEVELLLNKDKKLEEQKIKEEQETHKENISSEESYDSSLFSFIGISKDNILYGLSKSNEVVSIDITAEQIIGRLSLEEQNLNLINYSILDNGIAIASYENKKPSCRFYDSSMNLKKTVDIESLLSSEKPLQIRDFWVSRDGERFIYTADNDKSLYTCKVDLTDIKIIKEMEVDDRGPSGLGLTAYGDGIIGFRTSKEIDNKRINFVGTINEDGTGYEAHKLTEGIDQQIGGTQISKNTVLWHDVNVVDLDTSSGIVLVKYNDELKKIKVEDRAESNHVILSNDGKNFATYLVNSNKSTAVIKVYDISEEKVLFQIEENLIEGTSKVEIALTTDTLVVLCGEGIKKYTY